MLIFFSRLPQYIQKSPTVGKQFKTLRGPVRTKGFGISNDASSSFGGKNVRVKNEPIKEVEHGKDTGGNGGRPQNEASNMLQKSFVYTIVVSLVESTS